MAPICFILSIKEGKEEFMVSVSRTIIDFSVINPKHKKDIEKFKKYVYQAEDAWRQVVLLTQKNKK